MNARSYGESAGAMSVAAHMVSPPSAGMFQRAILQSDPFTLSTKPVTSMLETGARLAERVNCTFDLPCLRSKPARELSANGNVFLSGKHAVIADGLTWTPSIDAYNLPVAPLAGFAAGLAVDVPAIVGVNRDEADFLADIVDTVLIVLSLVLRRDVRVTLYEEDYRALIGFVYKDKAPVVLAQYPPLPNNASNYDQVMDMLTFYLFNCPTRNVSRGGGRGGDEGGRRRRGLRTSGFNRTAQAHTYAVVPWLQAALSLVQHNTESVYTYIFKYAPVRLPTGYIARCAARAACRAFRAMPC